MKFLIDFKNTATSSEIDQYISDNQLTLVATYSYFNKVFLVSSNTVPPVTDVIETVVQDDINPIVPLSYPVNSGETFPTVEWQTNLDDDWWKMAVQISPNFAIDTQIKERRGQCAIVYVVDSGIKVDHEEFEFATVSNLFSFNDDHTDHNGHGTAIASLICGKTCAISDPEVKSVKIFQAGVDTLKSDLIRAFDAIAQDVAITSNKFHVVNLSWGIPRDLYIESKIRDLINAGVWVVAAAGNGGTTIENITPACMPEVFTVGAFGVDLRPCDFSNYTGPVVTTNGLVNSGELDVWAPGINLKVATTNGSYSLVGGTSMSAAIHSAAIAYNSHEYCLSDGTPAPLKTNDKSLSLVSYGKPDLVIKDEQYALSSNQTTIFLTEYDGAGVTYAPVGGTVRVINSQEDVVVLLGASMMIENLTIRDPLPEGLRLEGRWLVGNVNYQDWHVFETEITYTQKSGSVYTKPAKFIFSPGNPSSFTAEEIAVITPYNFCGGPGDEWQCTGDCFNGFCLDACGVYKEFASYCYCYPPYAVCP